MTVSPSRQVKARLARAHQLRLETPSTPTPGLLTFSTGPRAAIGLPDAHAHHLRAGVDPRDVGATRSRRRRACWPRDVRPGGDRLLRADHPRRRDRPDETGLAAPKPSLQATIAVPSGARANCCSTSGSPAGALSARSGPPAPAALNSLRDTRSRVSFLQTTMRGAGRSADDRYPPAICWPVALTWMIAGARTPAAENLRISRKLEKPPSRHSTDAVPLGRHGRGRPGTGCPR